MLHTSPFPSFLRQNTTPLRGHTTFSFGARARPLVDFRPTETVRQLKFVLLRQIFKIWGDFLVQHSVTNSAFLSHGPRSASSPGASEASGQEVVSPSGGDHAGVCQQALGTQIQAPVSTFHLCFSVPVSQSASEGRSSYRLQFLDEETEEHRGVSTARSTQQARGRCRTGTRVTRGGKDALHRPMMLRLVTSLGSELLGPGSCCWCWRGGGVRRGQACLLILRCSVSKRIM